jgi:hypothetical protein
MGLGVGRGQAFAQTTVPATVGAFSPALLPRADWSFLWGTFINGDPRFAFDGRLVADIDLVNYGVGRSNLIVDYEAIISHERRYFDLEAGNYVLEGSSSVHAGRVEISGVFHHESRHLVDRENAGTISWNVTGVRVARRFAVGGATIDTALDLGKVTQPAFVDYTWTSNLRIAARRPLARRAEAFGVINGDLVGVDRAKYGRERQCGARFEGGVRVVGTTGGLDLFAAYERRTDGFPTGLTRVRDVELGLRIATR